MVDDRPGRSGRGDSGVTLRAVAARAGVSKSLVSRVLQGSPHVSDKRRLAVEEAIRELGYRPNGTARSLAQRRTGAVGVLVNDLRQPWFVDFLEGLHSELHAHDLHALMGDGRLDRSADERLLKSFMGMRVDGLILAGTMPSTPTILEASNWLPMVVAGSRDFDLPRVDIVAEDDRLGAELALDHLYELGHRRISHIAGRYGKVFHIRKAAYEAWMHEHNLEDSISIVACDTSEPGGYRAGLELLQRGVRPPTAILVGNDLACVGTMAAARDCGLGVPRDVSLIAFDNSMLARMGYINLTSVDMASRDVGILAASYLVSRISDPRMPARHHLAAPHLEIRGSTAESTGE